MATVLTIWGSPTRASRTGIVAGHVSDRLETAGHRVDRLAVRDLPAQALLHADFDDPAIRDALSLVEKADALVVASPVYKAAYSGVLKTFLDVLPQVALRGKSVLPVLTGGTPAHVLALDYALRPVLTSLGATHISQGWFVHEAHITPAENTTHHHLNPDGLTPLTELVDTFATHLTHRETTPTPTQFATDQP